MVLGGGSRVSEDEIDLVLNDDNLIKLHDLHRGQMLASLRLRTSHIS